MTRDRILSLTGNTLLYGLLSLVFLVTFFPFWQIFILSINDGTDSLRGGFMLWPREFSLDSYATVFSNPEILTAIRTTVLRTVLGVPLTVACIAMLAYVLSKRTLAGSRFLNLFFIFTMYFSGGLIPTYMVIKSLHLIDNFLVFLLPGLINIFWMILVRTFMEQLPKEIEESAEIDGANDIRIFVQVILPVCVPVLATITLFAAIFHWNAWYDSYIYTYKPDLKTLQAVLVKILNQYQTGDMLSQAQQLANENKRIPVTGESIRMTVTMVATLPIILVYPFLQKFFLKGMLLGAVKS
ncbi:carbohydrate ABC transporter permease [Paenibacillus agaridevorans]|uniref:carbohydrate ABC transporter permease n=1 Tax=Paenibacillus agaridevorans TaxID=171404 RepID=UPI001BE469DA|nr:carbohydrate ABC transporter permease [Paenibacillus agaridevorans]